MVRLGWSYSDLCECPTDVLAEIIAILNESGRHGK